MWTLPNTLTILRLIAAPLLPLFYLFLPSPHADWAATVVFVLVAATDWLDGVLARAWGQVSKIGAMLDPIADKAMVIIALMVVVMLTGLTPWVLIPATIIVFREVFVSGLREFLGDTAGTLKVTRLAKWKTGFQMTAITLLLAVGIFEHYLGMAAFGMDPLMVDRILAGEEEDLVSLNLFHTGMIWSWFGGIALLWISAALTAITGFDYFLKSRPYLVD